MSASPKSVWRQLPSGHDRVSLLVTTTCKGKKSCKHWRCTTGGGTPPHSRQWATPSVQEKPQPFNAGLRSGAIGVESIHLDSPNRPTTLHMQVGQSIHCWQKQPVSGLCRTEATARESLSSTHIQSNTLKQHSSQEVNKQSCAEKGQPAGGSCTQPGKSPTDLPQMKKGGWPVTSGTQHAHRSPH